MILITSSQLLKVSMKYKSGLFVAIKLHFIRPSVEICRLCVTAMKQTATVPEMFSNQKTKYIIRQIKIFIAQTNFIIIFRITTMSPSFHFGMHHPSLTKCPTLQGIGCCFFHVLLICLLQGIGCCFFRVITDMSVGGSWLLFLPCNN